MLEMLLWKLITTTFSYYIMQKLIKETLEVKSYFMKVYFDLDFQHIETEFNEVKVQKVWW